MNEPELYRGREQTQVKHFILRKYLERCIGGLAKKFRRANSPLPRSLCQSRCPWSIAPCEGRRATDGGTLFALVLNREKGSHELAAGNVPEKTKSPWDAAPTGTAPSPPARLTANGVRGFKYHNQRKKCEQARPMCNMTEQLHAPFGEQRFAAAVPP